MDDCRRIEALLPPYVDGEASYQDAKVVEAHLAGCRVCQSRVHAERAARVVLRARAEALVTSAPPGLRARLAASMRQEERPALGWRGRLTAFGAAAAALVLVVGLLELVTPQSSVLLAAQLAIDHVRCFIIERATTAMADAETLERTLAADYGWSIEVPASDPEAGLTLVAARRCPFWLGPYAHLLYRTPDGKEVSLYVAPGRERAAEQLEVFGHAEHLWTARGSSYVLIARGLAQPALARAAGYLERSTR
jgi:anti-sigma factor RsiW